MSAPTHSKAPRGYKRPSRELQAIIDLVNLTPAEVNLPETLIALAVPVPEDQIEVQFRAALLQLPERLREHLLREADDPRYERVGGIANALRLYNDIRHWREALQTIARRGWFMWSIGGSAMIDWQERKIVWSMNRLITALDGVDLRHIRECSVCGRIYFAGRLVYGGSELEAFCGRQCGHRLRQRRYEQNRELKKFRESKRRKQRK